MTNGWVQGNLVKIGSDRTSSGSSYLQISEVNKTWQRFLIFTDKNMVGKHLGC